MSLGDTNMAPLLSICIPTYNRESELREALESVVSQVSDPNDGRIEVVVSDNASTDGTQALMQAYASAHPWIRYSRSASNIGPDRNFFRIIELANGSYCWWLGSDDGLESGAIERVLDALGREPHFLFLNANTYDKAMLRCLGPIHSALDFSSPDSVLKATSSWISFISSCCFKKSSFLEFLEAAENRYEKFLSYCYVIVNVVKLGRNEFIQIPVVKYRTDNAGGYNIFDTFLGEFERLLLYCESIGYSQSVCDFVVNDNYRRVLIPCCIMLKGERRTFQSSRFWGNIRISRASFVSKLRLIAVYLTPLSLVLLLRRIRGLRTAYLS